MALGGQVAVPGLWGKWSREPVPYGQPGWAGQFVGSAEGAARKYQPSVEYAWRAARRRPEFTALVTRAYADPELGAEFDCYDWANDEGCEALTVPGRLAARRLEELAESRGMSMEWGDEAVTEVKVWLIDPVVAEALEEIPGYDVYAVRSQAAEGEGHA